MEDDKHRTMVQPKNQDFDTLTGKSPISAKEWCEQNADVFK